MVVEDFAVIRTLAHLTTTHSMGAYGMSFLHPVRDVNVVDVLLDDVVSTEPHEVIPIAHLVLHFGQLTTGLLFQVGALFEPGRGAIPVNAHGSDVANRALVQPLHCFNVRLLMMTLQTDSDLEILLFRFGSGGEEFSDSRPVDRHRL